MTTIGILAHNQIVRSDLQRRHPAALGADEAELVRLLHEGEPLAMTEIWNQHSTMVLSTARRLVRNDALAFEITQDVFVALWNNSNRVDLKRGTLKAFLKVLTHHRSVDVIRHESARQRREDQHHSDRSAVLSLKSPDELIPNRLAVRTAVAALPPNERAAVELAYFGERTYREVAVELNIPEGTAKSRLRNGLRRLERLLVCEAEPNPGSRAS